LSHLVKPPKQRIKMSHHITLMDISEIEARTVGGGSNGKGSEVYPFSPASRTQIRRTYDFRNLYQNGRAEKRLDVR